MDDFDFVIDNLDDYYADLDKALMTGNGYDVTRLIDLLSEHNISVLNLSPLGDITRDKFAVIPYKTLKRLASYNVDKFIFCHPEDINSFKEVVKGVLFTHAKDNDKKLVVFSHYTDYDTFSNNKYILYNRDYVILPFGFLTNKPQIRE